MNTFFVIETLETLRKAGRLSGLKAFVANTLNIKPVMGSTKEGTIQQLGQARGMKKALSKMVEDMFKVTKNCENRVLAISHCNCPERAQFVKDTIEKVAKFKKIVIVNTAGVSSMYARIRGEAFYKLLPIFCESGTGCRKRFTDTCRENKDVFI